jgi:DNA-binding transcriptional ArsR family regulator
MSSAATLCTACHANGYQCERPAGHDGEHDAGDYQWAGTTRWRETQNRVLRALMDAPKAMATREAAEATGLHIRTVRRHVRLLEAEGLAETRNGRWAA